MNSSSLVPRLPSQIPSLNGMRALSIGMVIVAHGATTHGAPAWMDHSVFTSLGNVGVRFFFLISGFLITTLLLRDIERNGHVRLKTFYVRRAYRILPAVLVYIGVMWALYLAGVIDLRYRVQTHQTLASAIPDLLHALTFTSNYLHDYNWYYNHLWSLSVEEQFYLLWPLALIAFGVRRAVPFACFILVLSPLLRLAMYLSNWGPEIALSREFQAVADALATGCLSALLFNRLTERPWFMRLVGTPAVPIAGLCIALGYGSAFVYRPAAYVFGQTVANLGIALLLQHVVRFPDAWLGRLMNWRVLTRIGVMSYSLYLWQEPFLYFQSHAWATGFPVNIVLLAVAAWASYHFVEQPFLRLKERRAGAGVPAV